MGKIKLTYIFSAISFILLIIVLFFIQKREVHVTISPKELEKVPGEEEILESRRTEISWMGVYLRGEKIGYIETKETEKPKGFEISQRMFIQVIMLGEKKGVTAQTIVNTDKNFRLRTFDFFLISPDSKMKLMGERKGTKLILSYGNRKETIELGEIAFLPVTLEAFLKDKKIKEGEKLTFRMFDPSVKQVSDATLYYKGREKIELKGKEIDTDVYEYEFAGVTQRIFMRDGEIIREELPFDMVLVKESREEAIKLGEKPIDLLFKYAVKPKGSRVKLDARKVVYRLSNINPDVLDLEFAGQRLIQKGEDYAVIEVEKTNLKEIDRINIDENLKEFLKPTLFIQCESPEIIDTAKKWAEGKNVTLKTKSLLYKVFNYLTKEPSVTIPSAIDVLHNRKGDCNEHSILYATLLRAINVPSQIAVGLIYQEGYFWYHAWNAVYLNEWIFVDPTYAEFPASPLHIMLKLGDIEKQAEVAPIVGKIEIEILEID